MNIIWTLSSLSFVLIFSSCRGTTAQTPTPYQYIASYVMHADTSNDLLFTQAQSTDALPSEEEVPTFSASPLSRGDLLVIAASLLEKAPVFGSSASPQKTSLSQSFLPSHIIENLQLIPSHAEGMLHDSVQTSLEKPLTLVGQLLLSRLLLSPQVSTKELCHRQAIIKSLVENHALRGCLEKQLQSFKEQESLLLSLWNKEDCLYQTYIADTFYSGSLTDPHTSSSLEYKRIKDDTLFWTMPFLLLGISRILNTLTLDTTTFLSHSEQNASPLSPQAQRELIAEHKKEKSAFLNASTFIMWAFMQTLIFKKMWNKQQSRNRVIEFLRQRFSCLLPYKNMIQTLEQTVKQVPFSYEMESIFTFYKHLETSSESFFSLLNSADFQKTGFFAPVGAVLASLPQFIKLHDHIGNTLEAIGIIDAYISIAKTYEKAQSRSNSTWCFATYLTETRGPSAKLTQVWNPLLPPLKAKANTVDLGEDGEPNILISGPNAGGKSTIMKSIIIALLLGQTIGICPAQQAFFTPFTYFETYLHVTDNIHKNLSRFKAEVVRAQSLLTTINQLPEGSYAFTVIDELFSGTSPDEGAAAAFAVAANLARCNKSIALFTSHFPVMQHLSSYTDNKFSEKHVRVIRCPDGSLEYPYQLFNGYTFEKIGLELLEKENFNGKVLDYAHHFLSSQLQR